MKLLIGQQMVMPALESVRLGKTRNEAAACLTATVLIAPADTYFLKLSVAVGREIAVRDGALTVTKGGGGAVPLKPERVLEVSGRASMGNMVNRAVVTGRNGRVLATAQNTGDITACGRFQRVMGKSGDPQAQAKAALRRRSLSARVTVLGDLSLRCGGRVEAHRPQWGLEGVYDITAHEHRWEKGVFTTSLSLEGVEA